MATLPRLAIGTLQPDADRHRMVWALMESFRRRLVHVQNFLSRACFPDHPAAVAITGLRPRYLDSWLMDHDSCREILAHGSRLADLAIVEGEFGRSTSAAAKLGGDLEILCEWLTLPRIVILDASKITGGLPDRPAQIEGVLLDRVGSPQHLACLTTDVQAVWRVPVLGSLPNLAELDQEIERLSPGETPSPNLIRMLGDELSRSWRPDLLHSLAQSQPIEPVKEKLFRSQKSGLRLTVAVAFDEAFDGYFPCGLDMLEARGATIIDFSPLRDEYLPPDCDIVLLGGGHPQRHASALSDNHCMKTALRNHVRWGRRIFSEGGGVAFLCQQMVTPEGDHARMAGLFPAVAHYKHSKMLPTPFQANLCRPNWLGHAGVPIRGYRTSNWSIEPLGPLSGFFSDVEHRFDMVGTFQAIGSLVEIHFGAQSNILNHFFYPHMPTPPDVDPWKES